MSQALDDLTAAVAANTATTQAAVAAFGALAPPEDLSGVTAQVQANTAQLAALVPAPAPTPTPTE